MDIYMDVQPQYITVTVHQVGMTSEQATTLLVELTGCGYPRHLETELPSMGAPGADLQHYQLGSKIPGIIWGRQD